MQYKTAEVTARCKGLTRVNIYKNRVKLAAGLPILPNREALQVSAAQRCTLLLQALMLPKNRQLQCFPTVVYKIVTSTLCHEPCSKSAPVCRWS